MKDIEKQINTLVNDFIKKWIPEYYPHLVDSDENDGERLRVELLSLFTTSVEEIIGSDEEISQTDYESTTALNKGRRNELRAEQRKRKEKLLKP